jgi:polyadenylate-binding protein
MATVPTTSPFSTGSLYVGDLATEVTEANLYEIFSQIGPVASIRVCRDAITRRSLGYAYVNFLTPTDAENAINHLNNAPIKGRPCRVMWSQRDPSQRKSGKGNIFIKNLDKSINHKDLHDTFMSFGNIVSCKVELDKNNESKGYGYIQYETLESAEKAIKEVDGKMMKGKIVYVGPFVSRKERVMSEKEKTFTNVYVKNLSETVDDAGLLSRFNKYGEIRSALIMKDEQGKSKGFAFINFATADEAQKAVDDLNNKEIDGRTVYVGRAQKKAEREVELKQKFENIKQEQMAKYQGVNLYIKNLDDDINDDKLRQIFSPFGSVTSCKVMFDSKGNSKGFGFVCYSAPEEATKAVTEMNGKIINAKPLFVALAQRKEVRKAQLEAQFAQRKMLASPVYGAPGTGPAVFYPPGAQPGFVYPMQMARGRFPPGAYQPVQSPNYVFVGGRGGQVKNSGGGGRGGVYPRGGRGGGMRQAQVPVQNYPQQAQVPVQEPVSTRLTAASLADMPMDEQKNVLGERLYPLIEKAQPELAGKITGMVLECPNEEILGLLENSAALNLKIQEALNVLMASQDQ